jgi:hypothetical protein
MRNCPSAVASARTTATRTPSGVDIAITSDEPTARAKIVTLTRFHASLHDSLPGLGAHTGLHGGPGNIGFCPIIHASTRVTFEPTDDGVRVHVVAISPADVSKLQAATAARDRALAPPTS